MERTFRAQEELEIKSISIGIRNPEELEDKVEISQEVKYRNRGRKWGQDKKTRSSVKEVHYPRNRNSTEKMGKPDSRKSPQ